MTNRSPLNSVAGTVADQPVDAPVILFVDDEQAVLDGLRNSLRKIRRRYRLLFADGAAAAIRMLETEPVDMVITDIRMPERNGVDLLEEVRFRFPDVIRYVLSGQAEERLVRRSVPVTHRWINKPCPRDELVEAIGLAIGHREEIDDYDVRMALAATDSLPTPGPTRARLVTLLSDRTVGIDEVADAAATDPAFTAKLLQWANSAFSDGRPVVEPRRAIARIGLEALVEVATAEEMLRSNAIDERVPGFDPELLHRHANEVARLAGRLARDGDRAVATTAGLLSHVGLLISAGYLHRRLVDAHDVAEEQHRRLVDVELERHGLHHAELGAHLLGLWGIPPAVIDAVIGAQDRPDLTLDGPLRAADAVRVARLLSLRSLGDHLTIPHRLDVDEATMGDALDRWHRLAALD
jgi:HD-like signal output (HDOD) protein